MSFKRLESGLLIPEFNILRAPSIVPGGHNLNQMLQYRTPRRRFTPFATRGFFPSDVANLEIWLNASAEAFNDNDPVGTWTDQSGNGNHATAAGDERPLYKTGIMNGKPVIRGDGINDFLTGARDASLTQTLFIVAQKRSATDATQKQLWHAGGVIQLFSDSDFADDIGFYADFEASTTNMPCTETDPNIFVLQFIDLPNLDLYVNGGAVNNIDPHNLYDDDTGYAVFASQVGGTPGDFDVPEVVYYDAVISDANIDNVGNYLGDKYGINWTAIS